MKTLSIPSMEFLTFRFLQLTREVGRGELAPLIGVEDLRLAVLPSHLLQGLDDLLNT